MSPTRSSGIYADESASESDRGAGPPPPGVVFGVRRASAATAAAAGGSSGSSGAAAAGAAATSQHPHPHRQQQQQQQQQQPHHPQQPGASWSGFTWGGGAGQMPPPSPGVYGYDARGSGGEGGLLSRSAGSVGILRSGGGGGGGGGRSSINDGAEGDAVVRRGGSTGGRSGSKSSGGGERSPLLRSGGGGGSSGLLAAGSVGSGGGLLSHGDDGGDGDGAGDGAALPMRVVVRKVACALVAVVACVLIALSEELFGEGLLPGHDAARRALGLFVLMAVLWATEAIPVYATALLAPVAVVLLRVLVDPDDPSRALDAADAAKATMASLFSGTVLVALGAFTMSLALSKYGLSHRIALAVLRFVGTNPKGVLLVIMFLGLFLSMWINNVASPVVVVAVVEPLLQQLGVDHAYSKALLLGIAFSNNIGGMTTPIASPQNLVAFHVINHMSFHGEKHIPGIGWGRFLAVSLPYSVACNLVAFGFVWLYTRPKLDRVPPLPQPRLAPLGWKHYLVMGVCVLTVALWAAGEAITPVVGSPGIVGLLPVIVFFTLPVLDKDDFKELQWDVLMLLAGGLALGDALSSSGLLHIMAAGLADFLGSNASVFVVLLVFSSFIWGFGNFISHTVAAIVVLPILAGTACHIGGTCVDGHFRLLVVGAVLLDSGAMGLPVTSFPNAQTFALRDAAGTQFLKATDFVKTGFAIGIFELGLLLSIGYGLMLAVGF